MSSTFVGVSVLVISIPSHYIFVNNASYSSILSLDVFQIDIISILCICFKLILHISFR